MDQITETMSSHKPFSDALKEDLKKLEQYYETDWIRDYEADERGEIPSDLKRGILSEDALYDLLYDAENYMKHNFQNFKSSG